MKRQVVFLKSAVQPNDFPAADRPEIALVGRSNAGKSSLLNALAGGKLARVSQVPGKTRLLNFFDVGQKYRLVDMPGYGFASRSSGEMLEWQEMITRYFEQRENLNGIVLIMDARREWAAEEDWIRGWVGKLRINMILALNKSDKLSRNELNGVKRQFEKILENMPIHLVSSVKNTGVDELEEDIFERFVLGAD